MVLAMVNMDLGGAIGKQYLQVSMHGINGMVLAHCHVLQN
jgi:hypothetical protein